MEDCIFCKIIKGDIPCFKVYEDDRVLAFEDVNPISDGHTNYTKGSCRKHMGNIR